MKLRNIYSSQHASKYDITNISTSCKNQWCATMISITASCIYEELHWGTWCHSSYSIRLDNNHDNYCCLLSLKSGCWALLFTSRYTMSLPPDMDAIEPERRLTNEEELPLVEPFSVCVHVSEWEERERERERERESERKRERAWDDTTSSLWVHNNHLDLFSAHHREILFIGFFIGSS